MGLLNTECRLCKSLDIIVLENTKRKKKYFHCQNCDLIFLDYVHIQTIDIEKKRYDCHNNSESNIGYMKMMQEFANEYIYPNIKSKSDLILDYGCGPNPVLAEIVRQTGYEVFLYDKIYNPDFELIPKVDCIVCTEVVEHFANVKNEWEQMLSKGKKKCMLVATTGFHCSIKTDFFDWWYIRDITHISFYSKKTMAYIAKIFNFAITYIDNNTFILKKND